MKRKVLIMKNAIKILAVLALLAVVMMMATGCSITATVTTSEVTTTEAATEMVVMMPNPMKEVTLDELSALTSIKMYAPSGAENIKCFTIGSGMDMLGQMDFTLNGKEYTYRATYKEMDPTSLSGMYFTKATEAPATVKRNDGKFITEDKSTVLFWEDRVPGVSYTLTCKECDDPAVLLAIAEDVFISVTDDGLGYMEMPTEYPDLDGTWKNADGHTVELIPTGDHNYDVNVSIVRLSQFPGHGELSLVSMSMELEDPNGGTIYAEFYQNDDGTGTLVISESQWNLLENKTTFTGFVKE